MQLHQFNMIPIKHYHGWVKDRSGAILNTNTESLRIAKSAIIKERQKEQRMNDLEEKIKQLSKLLETKNHVKR